MADEADNSNTKVTINCVVEISSVVAGLGLIWWSIELYRLADNEEEGAIIVT